MTLNVIFLLLSSFLTTSLGRLEPIRYGGINDTIDDIGSQMNGDGTRAVGEIISILEQYSPSLSKGVMVVLTNCSDDVPFTFLRTLQDRHEQPVYTANMSHLLTEGRSLAYGWRPYGKEPDYDYDDRGNYTHSSLPLPCRWPVGHGHKKFILPLQSRYVVLFYSHGSLGPFTELADLNYTFWDANVYYLFVVQVFDHDLRKMVYSVWRNLYIYKIIVVTPSVVKLLDPFVRNAVNGRFLNIPLWSVKKIPGIQRAQIRNLHRFPLRFAINNRTPTVIATESGTYVGQDGTFAAVLAAKMNATPVYINDLTDSGKIYYGYKQTDKKAYGTFAGVLDGWADVSVNGHFLKDYNCYSAELTRHITSDKVCLLAPKAGVIPPMMTVLMSFQREVWMMTAITCIIVTLIYYVASALELETETQCPRPIGCDLGLEIYRMFIGAPTNRIFAYTSQRILTAFCLIFTLVILNAFQGSLVTFLNTPMHYPDINTFTDLIHSDLPIRTSSISFKGLLTGDPNLKSLAIRVEKWAKEEDIYNSDGRFAGFQRVNVFNLDDFKDVLFVANKNNTRVLHTMNECLISYFISYVVHRNSPYKRRINLLLSWIDQAGLILKWNSDVSKYIFNKCKPINPKDYDTSKVFSVRDLEIAFIVLSFGIILSISVFIIELLLHKSPKIHTPHPPHLPFMH